MSDRRRETRFRRGYDDLGLRRALSDRILPLLVAAMAFLAALAAAGAVAASSLALHWQEGAGASLTVQVPRPDEFAESGGTRMDAALAVLRDTPGIAAAQPLTQAQLRDLLKPWLGSQAALPALPLPGVVAVRLASAGADLQEAANRLSAAAPGSLLEAHEVWRNRLSALARSLQACAFVALLVVGSVAVAVIAIATRAGLSARREAIEIVHLLGATDGYIARRFAARATRLAGTGGLIGAVAALPVLLGLAVLSAPFAGWADPDHIALGQALPPALWATLPSLPLAAAVIGWLTAQTTVRRWLRRLP